MRPDNLARLVARLGPAEGDLRGLAQERAATARQWLVDAGIHGDKLVAKGYGYLKPVADNRIRQGRQANRRVVFVILEREK